MSDHLFTPAGLWRALTPADRLVSVLTLVAPLVWLGAARFTPPADAGTVVATVQVGSQVLETVSLGADREWTVAGRHGDVTLRVEDGAIRVVEASCPQKICVSMGEKRRGGEIIACVPNALVVQVAGPPDSSAADTPDAITR